VNLEKSRTFGKKGRRSRGQKAPVDLQRQVLVQHESPEMAVVRVLRMKKRKKKKGGENCGGKGENVLSNASGNLD